MNGLQCKKLLWFDVESKYEATLMLFLIAQTLLWFDVESKYEATAPFH